jgi:hypothetical protein
MIQRKQTLFLILTVLSGAALLSVPSNTVNINTNIQNVSLLPLNMPGLHSTSGHLAAIVINFGGLILSFITIFLYKKRELQLKLCYALMVLWLVLASMISFCPFVITTEVISVQNNYMGSILGIIGMLASYMAAKFVRKDIELLKSADRIR